MPWWVISSPDAMDSVDPDFAAELGYEASELEGRPPTALVHPDDLLRTEVMLSGLSTNVDGFRTRWICRSGAIVELCWSAARWSQGRPQTMLTCEPA